MPLSEAVQQAGLVPDVAMRRGDVKADKLYFVHRRTSVADMYFLDNHTDSGWVDTLTFRTPFRQAELWNPVEGRCYALPLLSADSHTATLPLRMAPRESYFVVLADSSRTLPPVTWQATQREEPVAGPWQVYFDPEKGGAGEVTFDELVDWSTHADSRIRYYSGTAVYRGRLMVQRRDATEKVFLRFSSLGAVARVIVNGQEAGIVWCSPWETDLTPFVREGDNEIEIEVANSLMNRMIGDAALPAEERLTYAYPEIVTPADTLVASGIIGPVSLLYRGKEGQ